MNIGQNLNGKISACSWTHIYKPILNTSNINQDFKNSVRKSIRTPVLTSVWESIRKPIMFINYDIQNATRKKFK